MITEDLTSVVEYRLHEIGEIGIVKKNSEKEPNYKIWKTLIEIARDFYAKPQANIPHRARAKAAYRFMDNKESGIEKILSSHYQSTKDRISDIDSLLDMLGTNLNLQVTCFNNIPTVSITSPVNNAIYLQNNLVTFTGSATDVEDGELTGASLVWTSSIDGQIGDGTKTGRTKSPVRIGTENDWVSVYAGGFHTLTIKSGGSLWAWGDNSEGQLGDGTTTNKLIPTLIN